MPHSPLLSPCPPRVGREQLLCMGLCRCAFRFQLPVFSGEKKESLLRFMLNHISVLIHVCRKECWSLERINVIDTIFQYYSGSTHHCSARPLVICRMPIQDALRWQRKGFEVYHCNCSCLTHLNGRSAIVAPTMHAFVLSQTRTSPLHSPSARPYFTHQSASASSARPICTAPNPSLRTQASATRSS